MATPRKRLSELKPRSLSLRKFKVLLGDEATAALVQTFGGTRVYVPTCDRLRRDHKLVRTMGWDAACRLCEEYGGVPDLKIPTGKLRRTPLNTRRLRKLRAKAVPISEIAKALHCTEKAVGDYLRKLDERRRASPQIDWTYQTTHGDSHVYNN